VICVGTFAGTWNVFGVNLNSVAWIVIAAAPDPAGNCDSFGEGLGCEGTGDEDAGDGEEGTDGEVEGLADAAGDVDSAADGASEVVGDAEAGADSDAETDADADGDGAGSRVGDALGADGGAGAALMTTVAGGKVSGGFDVNSPRPSPPPAHAVARLAIANRRTADRRGITPRMMPLVTPGRMAPRTSEK
jgi:hypothetical protein